MLKSFLGSDKFTSGLQLYLKRYSFGNANTDDLWECMSEVRLIYLLRSLFFVVLLLLFLLLLLLLLLLFLLLLLLLPLLLLVVVVVLLLSVKMFLI